MDFPQAVNFTRSLDVLEEECDILVPAALEGQITSENALRIKAKVIAEAANGPVDATAEPILREKGCLVIPDIYLNAGGVVVSYFEWLKNLAHVSFERMTAGYEKSVNQRIVAAIEKQTGQSLDLNLRTELMAELSERELVHTALRRTMVNTYHQIHRVWQDESLPDLRTAAFTLAIKRIGAAYQSLGVFP